MWKTHSTRRPLDLDVYSIGDDFVTLSELQSGGYLLILFPRPIYLTILSTTNATS